MATTDAAPRRARNVGGGRRGRLLAALAVVGGWTASLAVHAAPFEHGGRLPFAASTARYIDGAPPGFAGGFGENTCEACHFETAPNTAPGSVTLTGVPDVFTAGERYALTVKLDHPDASRGGFQLTARLRETGAQAGSLVPDTDQDSRVKIERSGGIEYASQRREGATTIPSGAFEWHLAWTAPDVPAGTVVQFHLAANAADNDETAEGDFVFTAAIESRADER